MGIPARFASTAILGAIAALSSSVTAAAPPEHPKNWTAPAAKIYAQKLSDEIMTTHPELISVTFHGVPPGQTDAYTMFADLFPIASAMPMIRTTSTSARRASPSSTPAGTAQTIP